MGEMKNILLGQLKDPKRSVEEQEKTLESVKAHIFLKNLKILTCHTFK